MDYQHRPHHTYYPLPPVAEVGRTPPFTRLLLLNAGQTDDPLIGSLSIYPLEPKTAPIPPYEALSYVWGTAPAQTSIYIDGCPLEIKPNLEAALRHLRLPTQARRLWVDALCIDQSNVDERTRQVKYMRFVYKYAARAVVWLGPWEPGVERAFELAEMLASVPKTLPDAEKQTAMLTILTSAPEAFENLNDIFDREYFVRSWCLQETVASAWAIAKCGEFEMSFFDLIATAPLVGLKRGQMLTGKPLEAWNMVSLVRTSSVWYNKLDAEGSLGPLLALLAGTRDFKATDPRDKIFSLLGISNEGLDPLLALTHGMKRNSSGEGGSQTPLALRLYYRFFSGARKQINKIGPDVDFLRNKNLQPNYSKDVVEVYRDLTRFLIARGLRDLGVLSHVQHTDDPAEGTFPSWVPKWFQPRSCSVLAAGCFLAGYSETNDRYFAEAQDMPVAKPAVQPDSLHLGGFHVDKVESVSEVMWHSLDSPLPFQAIWDQIFDFPITKAPMPLYRDGNHLALAVAFTLGAGPMGSIMGDPELMAQITGEREFSPRNAEERFSQQAQANAAAYLLACFFGDEIHSTADGYQERSGADYMRTLTRVAEANGGTLGDSDHFQRGARSYTHNRRLYLTESGYVGIGPKMMRIGDEVCVLYGGRAPFILRRMNDHHVFVGNTFLNDDDIMWGKTAGDMRSGRRTDTPSVMFELR